MSRWNRNMAAALALLGALAQGCAPAKEAAPAEAVSSPAPEPYAPPALKPFEDLPTEESPPLKRRAGPGEDQDASSRSVDLEESVVWEAALSRAKSAEELYTAAQEAARAGDRATLNEKGGEARMLFDRALEDTALFEQEIIASYTEQDPVVARIVRTRSTWFDRTLWLHKSASRTSK